MRRRILFVLSFAIIAVLATWYGTQTVEIPDLTIQQASAVHDSKKKVVITGSIASDRIDASDGGLSFEMKDATGVSSRVQYDGQDPVTPEQLRALFKQGQTLSVSGHSHGDYFHATGMTLH